MFEQLVESSPGRKNAKKWRYFIITAIVWAALVTGAMVAGVMAYDARLDDQYSKLVLVTPALPMPLGRRDAGPQTRTPQAARPTGFVAPATVPRTIQPPTLGPPVISTVAVTGGDGPGVPGGPGSGPGGPGDPHGVAGIDSGTEPPPPIEVKREEKREAIEPVRTAVRRSGGVLQGSAIRKVDPVYPIMVRQIRLGGQVVVEVVIDEQGNVKSARALSGPVLLKKAAEDAARHWKWHPTKLSDVPVQVIGSIVFNFNLN